jgi:hypothetical protein
VVVVGQDQGSNGICNWAGPWHASTVPGPPFLRIVPARARQALPYGSIQCAGPARVVM